MLKFSRLLLLTLFLQLPPLLAENYYVSTPAEITTIMASSQPGDTLFLRAGEWKDAAISVKGYGTEEKPIVIKAEVPGLTRLTGRSNMRIAGSWIVVDGLYFTDGYSPSGAPIEFRLTTGDEATNCRLTNTAIVDYNPSSKDTDYKWVSIYGTYNRVDHCFLKGKKHSGTTLVVWLSSTTTPNYHRIDHNYFGERPDLGYNGGETIRIGTSDWSMSDSYTLVEYNYFERCNGEIEIISNKSCENTYRYNTFYESEGTLTLRHGNRCYVYGNFFIGNGKNETGGVRIIGEDHQVYNNYFQDLDGDGYRSALAIMNGVPNSPLNRYFQVKRAQVVHNTFVDCYENFELGAGANDELSLPPLDCTIANNLVSTKWSKDVVNVEADPINLTWEGNIFYGYELGIEQPAGITWVDPLMEFSSDSLWRPASNSPILGAAVGSYDFVTDDMDGQPRVATLDVGADQFSTAPIINYPVGASETGSDWYPPPAFPEPIIAVSAGTDSLLVAIQQAEIGDIIELVSDGGIYENTATLLINKEVLIRVKDSLDVPPVIRQIAAADTARAIFTMASGGKLRLSGVGLDGMSGTTTPARYAFRTTDGSMSSNYKLNVNDCYIYDVSAEGKGNILRATAGSFADSIVFNNCLFSNIGSIGFKLNEEAIGSGNYNVEKFELTNSTFWNIASEVVSIYAGDDIMFTACPFITIDHCTFDNCGYNGTAIIDADQVDFTTIKNSLFSYSANGDYTIRLFGLAASIHHCDLYEVGSIQLGRSAHVDDGMLTLDPGYQNRAIGNFALSENSPILGKADDGKAIGDLRWTEGLSAINSENVVALLPQDIILHANYPNPFNPQTTIEFSLPSHKQVTLQIFNMQGQLIETLVKGNQNAGNYSIAWHPTNLSSGVYFYRLQAGSKIQIRKMMLIK